MSLPLPSRPLRRDLQPKTRPEMLLLKFPTTGNKSRNLLRQHSGRPSSSSLGPTADQPLGDLLFGANSSLPSCMLPLAHDEALLGYHAIKEVSFCRGVVLLAVKPSQRIRSPLENDLGASFSSCYLTKSRLHAASAELICLESSRPCCGVLLLTWNFTTREYRRSLQSLIARNLSPSKRQMAAPALQEEEAEGKMKKVGPI